MADVRTIPEGALQGLDAGAKLITRLAPHQGAAAEAAPSKPWVADSAAPRHCGTAMEWKAPASGAMYLHTFEGPGPAPLPPVWRCGCGFQLDGGFDPREAPDDFSWQSR